MASGELSSWLKEHDVETVAMESTGVFWKPIFNILEDDFEVFWRMLPVSRMFRD